MYKKTIKYTDYNGVDREEDFYFNLTMAEMAELELGTTGTFTAFVDKIIQAQDTPALIKMFKQIIALTYGEKDLDGRHFIKEDDDGHKLFNKFKQTEAYSVLYMELATDDKAASEFINGVMPREVQEEVAKEANEKLLAPAA